MNNVVEYVDSKRGRFILRIYNNGGKVGKHPSSPMCHAHVTAALPDSYLVAIALRSAATARFMCLLTLRGLKALQVSQPPWTSALHHNPSTSCSSWPWPAHLLAPTE